MSRNGSGTYTLPAGNPVVTGTTISTTWANNTLNDIAATLTDSIAADGQTPMTGDLDLNSNKIVNLAVGTFAGDAVEYSQLVAATSVVAITGGTINGATIGATTPASGRFTTLEATGAFTAGSTAAITGNTTVGGTFTVTGISTFTGNGSFNGTGALKVPVGTTAQQPTPVTGQIRYNTTNNQYEGYGASAWGSLGGGATGGAGNQVFIENDQTVTVDYTIPATKNAGTFGPITIDTGVTVTVSTGSTWTVV
jgi:hypothetical protein